MKVMSQERLIQIRNRLPYSLTRSFIDSLITECEELTQDQWQTIEEFKANPVYGPCWINHKLENITIAFYNTVFFIDGCVTNEEYVTHVMPIKTPGDPK